MFTLTNTEGYNEADLAVLNDALKIALAAAWFENGEPSEREKLASERLLHAYDHGVRGPSLVAAATR